MDTATMKPVVRKLPSADWIAVGLGMLGLVLSRFNAPFFGLLGLAVFGPSILRELGVLKDADEWVRGIMYRAGFHGTLATALFLFLNRVIPRFDHQLPELPKGTGVWFDTPFLWQTLVLVFLISYLLQYWGSPKGSARILLGFGTVLLIDIVVSGLRWGFQPGFWPVAFGVCGLLYLLSWSVPRRPRGTGAALLVITVGMIVLALSALNKSSVEMAAGLVSTQVHILLVFGVTGWALLKIPQGDSE